MSPFELYESHRESLIMQRNEYVKRIMEINDELKAIKKDWDEKKFLI